MNNKTFLKILAGIIAFLLIFAVFFIANSFLGNPVSANIAKSKAQTYITDKYGHLSLEIKDVAYNLKDGYYVISVSSSTSIDTHFLLSYGAGEIFRDDYESSVLSSMNTMDRLCDEYKKSLTPLVQAKTNDVTYISVIPEKLTKYNLELDSAFDTKLVKNVDLAVRYTGGIEAKHFSEILKIIYGVMKDNGFVATNFEITGEHETVLAELRNIKPKHIENENLEEILQKAITNAEYDGITAFSKGQK